MPNWVSNVVNFDTTKSHDLNELFDFIHGQINGKELEIDFDKIIPTPKDINNDLDDGRDSLHARMYIYYYRNKKNYISDNNIALFSESEINDFINKSYKIPYFNSLLFVNNGFKNVDYTNLDINDIESRIWIKSSQDVIDALKRGAEVIRRILLYGYSNWYDFHVSEWGTKWNARDTCRINSTSIGFLTAWSTPEPIIKAISQRYPDLYIDVYYADEAGVNYNSGVYTYHNGHELYERYLDPDKKEDVILYYNIIDMDLERTEDNDDALKDELDFHYKCGEYEEKEIELEESFLEEDAETQKEILSVANDNGYNKAVINIKPKENNE